MAAPLGLRVTRSARRLRPSDKSSILINIINIKCARLQIMPESRLITAQSAATRLSISRATLYAYVSRGFVHTHADPNDPRRRLYSADDVDRLARNKVRGRKASDIAAATLD